MYNDPHADREVLDLVHSQFGQGFLELDFDDDTKQKPTGNSGQVQATKATQPKKGGFEFDSDQVYPVKGGVNKPVPTSGSYQRSSVLNLESKLDFENFESNFATTGQRNSKVVQPTNVRPQEKPKVDIFSGGRIEFDDDFNGFGEFNAEPVNGKPKPKGVRIDQPIATHSTYVGTNQKEINFDEFNQFGSAVGMNGGFGGRSAPVQTDPFFTDAKPVKLNNEFFGSGQTSVGFQEPARQSPSVGGFGDDFLNFDLAGSSSPAPPKPQHTPPAKPPNAHNNEFQFL